MWARRSGLTKAFLCRAVKDIAEIDYAIKQGRIEDWIAVEEFFGEMLGVEKILDRRGAA